MGFAALEGKRPGLRSHRDSEHCSEIMAVDSNIPVQRLANRIDQPCEIMTCCERAERTKKQVVQDKQANRHARRKGSNQLTEAGIIDAVNSHGDAFQVQGS